MKITFQVQGERRFFRVITKWMANDKDARAFIQRNMKYIPEFGRWDDLYTFVDTPLQNEALSLIKHQLALDVECNTPSLMAKWLKSENASSKETTRLGNVTRKYLGMTHKEYRKVLAVLRTRINVLEKLMSENKWNEIEFDKIPSKAGLIYKNAFAKHDVDRMKNENVQSYADFAKDTTKKVNAGTLYPYEVVERAIDLMQPQSYMWGRNQDKVALDNTDRLMINKYWDNLTDYFNGATFNALAMVDTSGSMMGTPMNVAVSLGLYCAEKAGGPFAGNYISFSTRPQLIACEGVDFCDKVKRIVATNLCETTNIEAAFDLLLDTAALNNVPQSDMPENIIVISDMEFNAATGHGGYWGRSSTSTLTVENADTVMETIAKKWIAAGYELPHLIFWNVNSHQDNIPMIGNGYVSYVSGFSPSIFQSIMTGKTGYELMKEKLDSPRYSVIH